MKTYQATALLTLALASAACGTENRGMDSVHQAVVRRTDYVLDVNATGGIPAEERRRISDWFDSLRLGYGDRVSIDNPDPYGDKQAYRQVASIVAQYGLLMNDSAPVTQGEIPSGALRVIVSRVKAEVPGCPDWSRPAQPDLNSNTSSNFGCATNSNLAAMIADPEDLLEGQVSNKTSSVFQSTKAIKAYRSGKPSGLKGLTREGTRGQ
jgi:pilus assembly protein CpaD